MYVHMTCIYTCTAWRAPRVQRRIFIHINIHDMYVHMTCIYTCTLPHKTKCVSGGNLNYTHTHTHTHTHTLTRTGSKYTVHVPEILRTSSSSSPSSLVHVQPSRSGEPAPVSMRRPQQQHAPHTRISEASHTRISEASHTRISATAASPMENTFYREDNTYAQQQHAPLPRIPRISARAAAAAASPAHPGAPGAPYLRSPYLMAVEAEEAAAGTAAVAAAVATAKAVSQMRHMPGYTSHLKRRCAQVDAAL